MCSLFYFFCKLKKYTTSLLWDFKIEAWNFLKPVALLTPSDISPLVNQILVSSAMCLCHLSVSEWKGQLFWNPGGAVTKKETRYHVVGTFSQWEYVTFLLSAAVVHPGVPVSLLVHRWYLPSVRHSKWLHWLWPMFPQFFTNRCRVDFHVGYISNYKYRQTPNLTLSHDIDMQRYWCLTNPHL